MKATNMTLTEKYLQDRAFATVARGYDRPKWIGFCLMALREGFQVELYEARKTVSKYVTLRKPGHRPFKVRFSNHKPIWDREARGDCDFFVGVSNLGVTTTGAAWAAVERHFGTGADGAQRPTCAPDMPDNTGQ